MQLVHFKYVYNKQSVILTDLITSHLIEYMFYICYIVLLCFDCL